jgi:uncharacterized protein (DUF1015 family)
MAEILPFRAVRYAENGDVSSLCSPPYDVLSQNERDELTAKNPHNVVELDLPNGSLDPSAVGNRYEQATRRWKDWQLDGVLEQDGEECIYVLRQDFSCEIAGAAQNFSRFSFIVAMKLYNFDEGVVLPHELTLPKALGDRYQMIKHTAANFSQVFGLFSENCEEFYRGLLEFAQGFEPVAFCEDNDGVRSTLWAISDEGFIESVESMLYNKQVFIADGHHRYTTALAYRDEVENEAADYLMVALTNMEDPQLQVLPYNRAVKAAGDFYADEYLEALSDNFDVKRGSLVELQKLQLDSDRASFITALAGDEFYLLSLRAGSDLQKLIDVDKSSTWKTLDVSILHELIIKPCFNISTDNAESLNRIAYSARADELLARLARNESDVVFLLNPTKLEQLREISLGGETMPQKSTYFYPKLPSGLVFRSIA